jgi:hypothetical protein
MFEYLLLQKFNPIQQVAFCIDIVMYGITFTLIQKIRQLKVCSVVLLFIIFTFKIESQDTHMTDANAIQDNKEDLIVAIQCFSGVRQYCNECQ